ncbi:hypothetical protein JCM3770_003441 [Rhodotorula araucariae]
MAVGVSRTFLPVLALAWVFSVVCLGLSGKIMSSGTVWPSELRNVMIQNVFAWSWNTLFTTILLIGVAVAPRTTYFGASSNFVLLFLGFLLAIVGIGSYSGIVNKHGYAGGVSSSIGKAYHGLGFVGAFMVFFAALYAGLSYVTGQATAPPPKKEEEVHF